MTDHIARNHARIFDTRWGQGLAFIDIDDGDECLRLQLWQAILEGGDYGIVSLKLGLSGDASDEAHKIMSEANRAALIDMTVERFESALEKAGIGKMLDDLAAKYPLE